MQCTAISPLCCQPTSQEYATFIFPLHSAFCNVSIISTAVAFADQLFNWNFSIVLSQPCATGAPKLSGENSRRLCIIPRTAAQISNRWMPLRQKRRYGEVEARLLTRWFESTPPHQICERPCWRTGLFFFLSFFERRSVNRFRRGQILAPLSNGEMWLVGAERWRTTATWSQASAWSELTTLDMFTFLCGLARLRVECGLLVYLFIYFGPLLFFLFV